MPSYTSLSAVKDLLPASFDTTALPDSKITEFIGNAGEMVDQAIGPQYPYQGAAKFLDYPNAPPVVEEITTWLAAARAWIVLKEANQFVEGNQAAEYRKMAHESLSLIREGKIEMAQGGMALATRSFQVSTENTDRTFTRGVYSNGVLQGDPGTLDGF